MSLTVILAVLLISVILCTISFALSKKLENKSHWTTDFSVFGFAWLVAIICSAFCLAALLIF